MKELDEQTRQRISNASVMYDEKLKSHFLFFAFDGKEHMPKQLPYLLAAKYRDGKVDVMDVVAELNPWLFNKRILEGKPLDRAEEEFLAAARDTDASRTDGQRFRYATGGLLYNMAAGGQMFGAWVSEIARRLWNDDTTGAYKEFSKGVEVGERLVQRALQGLRIEAGVARLRNYLVAAFDASVDALKGDFEQARLSARPLTYDLRRAGDVMFVQTGVLQMMQNFSNRMSGTERREDAKVSLFQATVNDARAVVHSEPVQKTVGTIIDKMERLEKSTRMDDLQKKELNRLPEDKLDVKHDRISDVRVYTSNGEMFHYVRCKIDGVQQSSRELRHQDYLMYEMGKLDRFELAEKYYAEDMHRARVAGLGR